MSMAPVALAKCCNTLVASFYRHDYVSCKCGKSFVDGGREYQRYGGKIVWLKKADAEDPKIKKLWPAFEKACKEKASRLKAENWEHAQKLFKDHGIMTKDFYAPKPKGVDKR